MPDEKPPSEQSHGKKPRDERPVLPRESERDRDEAWGDSDSRRGADWYERERPPHSS